eukprot:symbB.v1.2.021116.t1/scaffold1808.1/size103924/8
MIEEAVFCASLSPSQLGLSSIQFVSLQDTGKADDFLGYAELSFEQLSIGFEGELALKDASDTAQKVEAYVKVRVRNLGACVSK